MKHTYIIRREMSNLEHIIHCSSSCKLQAICNKDADLLLPLTSDLLCYRARLKGLIHVTQRSMMKGGGGFHKSSANTCSKEEITHG